jgi:hypothetical protein
LRAKSFLLFDGFFKKGFSARNRFVFIAACVAVKAARRFKNPATEPGFLFLFSSPAIEQGFFVFGPTPGPAHPDHAEQPVRKNGHQGASR